MVDFGIYLGELDHALEMAGLASEKKAHPQEPCSHAPGSRQPGTAGRPDGADAAPGGTPGYFVAWEGNGADLDGVRSGRPAFRHATSRPGPHLQKSAIAADAVPYHPGYRKNRARPQQYRFGPEL